MDTHTLYQIAFYLTLFFGFYMAWNVGANDVANAMGTSVGSKAITLFQAVLIASIFEFSGAFFVGDRVTSTIRKGIIDITFFSKQPEHLMYGMLAALIATCLWLHLATYKGLPVSTTHSIVGAVIGFGIFTTGVGNIKWVKVVSIVLSWIISPVVGGLLAFFIFFFITRKILYKKYPVRAASKYLPFLISILVMVLTMSLVYKGFKLKISFFPALIYSFLAGVISFVSIKIYFRLLWKKSKKDYFKRLSDTEKVFKYMQVVTACYVAFAHGSNDVANAVGPLSAVVAIFNTHKVSPNVPVPSWVLALGGVGIIVGIATYGYKVIKTIGGKITEITPTRGFSAEFGAATTILVCSKLGLPISTTHTLVGAVIGVGFARGIAALDLKVIRDIVVSWFVTIPFTAILTIFIYEIFKYAFLG